MSSARNVFESIPDSQEVEVLLPLPIVHAVMKLGHIIVCYCCWRFVSVTPFDCEPCPSADMPERVPNQVGVLISAGTCFNKFVC